MRTQTRLVAAAQLVLIMPAAVFLTAVLVGMGDPPQYELAHVARRIVASYAGKGWTLWVLLLLLPFAGLVTGSASLLRDWNRHIEAPEIPALAMLPAPLATLLVGWATLTSAAILAVVALHMAAN